MHLNGIIFLKTQAKLISCCPKLHGFYTDNWVVSLLWPNKCICLQLSEIILSNHSLEQLHSRCAEAELWWSFALKGIELIGLACLQFYSQIYILIVFCLVCLTLSIHCSHNLFSILSYAISYMQLFWQWQYPATVFQTLKMYPDWSQRLKIYRINMSDIVKSGQTWWMILGEA